jgi:hypothetical protein
MWMCMYACMCGLMYVHVCMCVPPYATRACMCRYVPMAMWIVYVHVRACICACVNVPPHATWACMCMSLWPCGLCMCMYVCASACDLGMYSYVPMAMWIVHVHVHV